MSLVVRDLADLEAERSDTEMAEVRAWANAVLGLVWSMFPSRQYALSATLAVTWALTRVAFVAEVGEERLVALVRRGCEAVRAQEKERGAGSN